MTNPVHLKKESELWQLQRNLKGVQPDHLKAHRRFVEQQAGRKLTPDELRSREFAESRAVFVRLMERLTSRQGM